MLTPCSGICLTPLTDVGAGSPVTSRMVGTTSTMWWYWLRIAPASLIFAGQETMNGSVLPPAWVSCFHRFKGALPAIAQPIG